MGNTSSSSGRGHHDESVDYGALVPQGVYTGPQDWNRSIVSQLIVSRKLAPFYRPLEEYDDAWDDDRILAARKEFPDSGHPDNVTRTEHSLCSSSKSKRPAPLKEPAKPEAQVYRGAVECPICFLYYPPNINRSRCCDQAICTECFVQIKRSEPTTTHLVSEPAACPYCVQENFGVVYTAPPWRAGVGSDHGLSSEPRSRSPTEPPLSLTHKRRQRSYSTDNPDVVLIDHIRPGWEAKLEAVRAAVARRANRRIIMRQVGDRLIPVGVTSGRVHALSPEEAAAAATSVENGSRRRRRVGDAVEQFMGMTGPDLEELMLMEAMRLSLLEHEEQQRKEAEERRKKEAAEAEASEVGSGTEAGPSKDRPNPTLTTPIPGPSILASQDSLSTSDASSLSTPPSSHLPSPSPSATNRSQGNPPLGPRASSVSRNRTPSPLPLNPGQNLPVSERNQVELRCPNEGPSTLNAVITAASTATTALGASTARSRSVTPDPASLDPASVKTSSAHTNDLTTLPIVRLGVEGSAPSQTSEYSAPSKSMYSDAPLPPIPKAESSSEIPPTSEIATLASTSMSHGFENSERSQSGMPNGSFGSGPSPNATVHIEDMSR